MSPNRRDNGRFYTPCTEFPSSTKKRYTVSLYLLSLLLKVLHGKAVRLTHAQLNAGHSRYFGPETYKKLVKAYESGKGTTLHMTQGEVLRTHQSGPDGSGFWRNLWEGIKSVGKNAWTFLKNNWKPIAGSVMISLLVRLVDSVKRSEREFNK
ncbi:hypothetical protein Plhal304r1_c035g0108131 [Plasmopara halstedii]